jgi:alpha-tubulin suppressor-like RCC1 family protein
VISNVPVEVNGITDASEVSSGDRIACALLSGGKIDCWGWNANGELGEGTLGSETCGFSNWFCSRSPVAVVEMSEATQVSAGSTSACALLHSGSVECWGENQDGQLGNGTKTGPEACRFGFCSTRPVLVSGITDAVEVNVGWNDACARLASGSVTCWGLDADGQLGHSSTEAELPLCEYGWKCSLTPIAVSGVNEATQIEAGYGGSACALIASGHIECWGENSSGQLGDGTTTGPSATPVSVSGIADATRISASGGFACALLSGGGIDCWGGNNEGSLGDGSSTVPSDVPVEVSGIAHATQVTTGLDGCALIAGGAIECWGANYSGSLGDGTNTGSSVPVRVIGVP